MDDFPLWFGLLVLPLALVAVTALFARNYRRSLAASMAGLPAPSLQTAVHAAAAAARTPLVIQTRSATDMPASEPAAARAHQRALGATRAADRCFLIAGGALTGVLLALHVWAVPPAWRGPALPIVLLSIALPPLAVLFSVVARSRAAWAAAALACVMLCILAVAAVAWRSGSLSYAIGVAGVFASNTAAPTLAVLLLSHRSVRPLAAGGAAVILFLAVGTALLALVDAVLALDLDLERGPLPMLRAQHTRWSDPVNVALLAATLPAGVWFFLATVRSKVRARWWGTMAGVLVIGFVIDRALDPDFPAMPLLLSVAAVALQCAVVWLLFKAAIAFESTHWLPLQALQTHLCWAYVVVVSLQNVNAHLELESAPSSAYVAAWTVLGAGFAGYMALLHVLLGRERRARAGVAPKRLLLLRVFGAADQRERLLDVLDDTWRRVGRVDLIAGTDLAMRTFGSLTLEAILLRRTEARFLKTEEEVSQAFGRLRDRLEGDLRFPINELYCYATVWPDAVMRLSRGCDVVLLDLRGFTRANAGCAFELASVVQQIPLERVVVLTDAATDEAALRDIAASAWDARSSDAADDSTAASRLQLLRLDGRSALLAVPLALFEAAYPSHARRA